LSPTLVLTGEQTVRQPDEHRLNYQGYALFFTGNLYAGDDGFAIHLYEQFKDIPLPRKPDIYCCGVKGLAMVDTFRPFKKLVVIDALRGLGQVGEIFRVDLLNENLSQWSGAPVSAHDIGIIETIEIVRHLFPQHLPAEIILIGVDIGNRDMMGTTLSAEIFAALTPVAKMIYKELESGSRFQQGNASPETIESRGVL